MIRRAKDRLVARAARPYVAGTELEDAIRVSQELVGGGFAVTACYWDDALREPEDVAAHYEELLTAAEEAGVSDFYLSVKAPALEYLPELVGRLGRAAASRRRRLHFDSHGPETVNPTFEAIELALALGCEVGCTLPGRWRRSVDDCERALRLGVAVRVVKGQWPDPEGGDVDPSQGFLELIDTLAGRAGHVGVATHDGPLAATALARLQIAGTPRELELLYGLPARGLVEHARATGVQIRAYVPYGHAWLPYAMRRAARNPRLLAWLLRDVARARQHSWPGR